MQETNRKRERREKKTNIGREKESKKEREKV